MRAGPLAGKVGIRSNLPLTSISDYVSGTVHQVVLGLVQDSLITKCLLSGAGILRFLSVVRFSRTLSRVVLGAIAAHSLLRGHVRIQSRPSPLRWSAGSG